MISPDALESIQEKINQVSLCLDEHTAKQYDVLKQEAEKEHSELLSHGYCGAGFESIFYAKLLAAGLIVDKS